MTTAPEPEPTLTPLPVTDEPVTVASSSLACSLQGVLQQQVGARGSSPHDFVPDHSARKHFKKGEIILKEGDAGDVYYFLQVHF